MGLHHTKVGTMELVLRLAHTIPYHTMPHIGSCVHTRCEQETQCARLVWHCSGRKKQKTKNAVSPTLVSYIVLLCSIVRPFMGAVVVVAVIVVVVVVKNKLNPKQCNTATNL